MGFTKTTFYYNDSAVHRESNQGNTHLADWRPVDLANGVIYYARCYIDITTDDLGVKTFNFSIPKAQAGAGGFYWKITETSQTTYPTVSAGKICGRNSSTGALESGWTTVDLAASHTYRLWIYYDYNVGSTYGAYSGPLTLQSTDPIYAGNISTKVNNTDVSSADIGATVDLSFASNIPTGSTYKVKYTFGSSTIWLVDPASSSSTFSWNTANSMAALSAGVTNAKTISGTITVYTYYGSATLEKTKSFTLNFTQANAGITAANGWMSLSRTQTSAVSSIAAYVQNYSKATLTLDPSKLSWPSNVTGSLSKWAVTVNGVASGDIAPSTSSYTSGIITGSGSITVSVTATDSRGYTVTWTDTITVYEYNNPSGGMRQFRCDSNGYAADSGSYISVEPNIDFSSINNLNSISITLSIAIKGSGNYTSLGALTNNTANVKGGSLQDLTYDVKVTATDALGNTVVLYGVMPSASWAIRFLHNNGKTSGAAIGKNAEYHNTFQVTSLWSMLHGDNRILEAIAGTSGTAATLPSAGTYLLVTSGSSSGLCGAFVIVTASNIAANIGGGADITVTVSGTNVTVTTSSGTANCHYIQLA